MSRKVVTLFVLGITFSTTMADARRIEQACNASPRSGSDRALCTCIQSVADEVLNGTDQKLAAKFFADPQMAQDIRQSDRRRHEAFWQRYKAFGKSAQTACR